MARRSPRAALQSGCLALVLLSAPPAWAQASGSGSVPTTGSPPTVSPEPADSLGTPDTASARPGAEPEPAEVDLVLSTMALDIASSDYYALAAWARSLGLEVAGGAQELRSRLYDHYGISAPPSAAASSKTITIVSADETEYLSAGDDGESMVRFSGRVTISVKDDDTGETLTIRADRIVVNKDANILSARGGIVFERRKADGTDFFLGEALELDMDDWSGVFLDGESKRGGAQASSGQAGGGSGQAGSDALFFRADDIIKRGTDLLVFKDGVVSSCDDDSPHYSIRASKIWILGGNEWAMQDATLSVGEIPLLYLPFFYYPGEEIVFHPVFGYDERFGRYVQTTTYLLGDKEPKEQEISLLKIADGSKGFERKVEGVFLRTTREPRKGKTADFVKVIVDLYSTLGGYVAAQAQVGAWGPLSSITGFAGLGLTRSAFSSSDGTYTPFVAAADYSSVWNSVDILGLDLPIRFGWELTTSLGLGPMRLSLSAPFYSDAYFNRDFKDRSEDMNWLQFLDQETAATTISKISTFTDTLSLTGSVPSQALPAWVSAVSLSKLSSSLSWNSTAKTAPSDANQKKLFAVDPANEFFAPYEWTVLDAAGSVSGTLFKYPASRAAARPSRAAAAGPASGEGASATDASGSPALGDPADESGAEPVGPPDAIASALAAAPELRKPWEEVERPTALSADRAFGFTPPPLASPESVSDRVPLTASLSWSWTPTFSWKRRFLTEAWKEPRVVDWSALYETRSARNAGTLSLTNTVYDGLLGVSLGLTASTQYQERPRVAGDAAYASDALLATWAKQDAQYRSDKVGASLKLTSSPLQDSWLWSPTSLSYALSSSLYEYAFDSMDSSAPKDASLASYKRIVADWTDDTVTAHALTLDIGLRPWGQAQSLSLAANLPPLLERYTGRVSLKSPWATAGFGTAYFLPSEGAEYAWDPLSANLSVGSAPWPTATASFLWSIQSEKPTSMSASVAWDGLTASLSVKEAVAYRLVYGSGWTSTGDPAFRVDAASLVFKRSWKPPAAWKNRIAWTVDVNASAQQSFLRFTDSSLNFVAGLTFKIHELLDLKFASTSKNSSLWRYYPGVFDIPSEVAIQPINPLDDLIASFNFLDATGEARRTSLFKLKSMSVTATHYLHDWDLAATFSASPSLDAEKLEYFFKPSFSLTLSWRSVSQIKSSYKKEGETVTWD